MAIKISASRERKATALIAPLLKKLGLSLEDLRAPGHTKANAEGRREVSKFLITEGFTFKEVGGLLNRHHTAISTLIGRRQQEHELKNPEDKTQTLDRIIEFIRTSEGHTIARKSGLLLAEEIDRLRAYEAQVLTGNLAGIVQQSNRQQALLRTYDAMLTAFFRSFKLLETSRLKTTSHQIMMGASHMLTATIGDTPDEKYRRELEERVSKLIAGEQVDFDGGDE